MVNAHLVKKHIQTLDAALGDAAIIALKAERKNLEVLQKAADILTNSGVAHSLLWVLSNFKQGLSIEIITHLLVDVGQNPLVVLPTCPESTYNQKGQLLNWP